MKKRKADRELILEEEYAVWPSRLFVVIELFLYIWFLTEDINGQRILVSSSLIKYASICLCFLTALYLYRTKRGNGFMLAAQTFILPADLILLFFDWLAPVGIGFFIAVQFCYFLRMRAVREEYIRPRTSSFERRFFVSWLIVSALILLALFLLSVSFDPTTVTAVFYIVLFFLNCMVGIYEAGKFQRGSCILMAVGLILFFLCDIHVGLRYMGGMFAEGSFLSWYADKIASVAMWLFYLPGQVLLVLSAWHRNDGWSVRKKGTLAA